MVELESYFNPLKLKEPHVASGFCMVSVGLGGSQATIVVELDSALQMAQPTCPGVG